MLLFENSTYDSDWAAQYYEDYYNAADYFSDYLNNDCPFDNIIYQVRRGWTPDHKNNKYEVTYLNKSDLFKEVSHKKYFAYMYNKLEDYGTSVNILHSQNINKLVFYYEKKYDLTRWESERLKHEESYKSDEILNCNPTLEQWIYMLEAKMNRKNPRSFLSKDKSIEQLGAKYIIATKLGWDDAVDAAMNKMSELLALPQNVDKYSPMFKKFIKSYANEKYEVDDEIKELIDDFKQSSKDASRVSIPTGMNKIIKIIENSPLVSKFQYISGYEIQILTTNGNAGAIYITQDTYLGGDFYKVVLHLKGDSPSKDRKSHSYKFHALGHTIESAIKAIYKNDPDELDKITIKI